MRITSDRPGDVVLLGEGGRPYVVGGEGLARVEDLDAVDLLPEPLECGALDVIQPVPAEGVRNRHDAALIVDALDRLLAREAARDRSFEEQPDDLAVAG